MSSKDIEGSPNCALWVRQARICVGRSLSYRLQTKISVGGHFIRRHDGGRRPKPILRRNPPSGDAIDEDSVYPGVRSGLSLGSGQHLGPHVMRISLELQLGCSMLCRR